MRERKFFAVLITLILMVSVFSISAFATDLQNIQITGAPSISMEPAFSAGVYNYTITVPADLNTAIVEATVDPATGATVEVKGADDFSLANNIVTVTVTDKDGVTKTNYTLNIEHEQLVVAPTTDPAQATTEPHELTTIPVYYVGIFLLLIVLAFAIGYLIAHSVTKRKFEDVEQPSSMPIIPQSQNKIRLQSTQDFGRDSHRATGHQVPRPVAKNAPIVPAEKEPSKKELKKAEKQKAQEEKLRLKQQQELEARLAKERELEEKEKIKQAKLEAKAAKKNKKKKTEEVPAPVQEPEIPTAAPMPAPSFVQGIEEPVATPAPIVEPELPVAPMIEPEPELPVEPMVELPVEPAVELPVEPAVELPVEPAFEAPAAPAIETTTSSFSFTRPDDFVMGSADDVELSEKDRKRLQKKEEEEQRKAEEKEQKKQKKSLFAKIKSGEEEETAERVEEDDFEGWQEEIPDSLAGFGFTAAAKLSDEFVQSADD